MAITNRDQLEAALRRHPAEVSVAIAARAALRVLPLWRLSISAPSSHGVDVETDIMLPLFRAMATPLASAKYPASGVVLSRAARAANAANAAGAAAGAANAAAYTARAANAAAYAARAAYAAGAAVDAAAAAVFWDAVTADLSGFESGDSSLRFAGAALWRQPPNDLLTHWKEMRRTLSDRDGGWTPWLEWYEDVLHGRPVWGLPTAAAEKLEVRILTQDADWWGRDAAAVNGDIAAWVDTAKLEFARIVAGDTVSPEPVVDDRGRLDVGPNDKTNELIVDGDIHKLPERQRRIVRNLIAATEQTNAPRLFGQYLQSYLSELDLGFDFEITHLKDDFAIIDELLNQGDAQHWLGDAGKIVEQFSDVHQEIINHYPLDLAREENIRRAPLDGAIIDSDAFKNVHAALTDATLHAVEDGLATQGFKEAVERAGRQLRDISSLENRPAERKSDLSVTDGDRVVPADVRKRFLFQQSGFWDRTLQRSANAAKLSDSETVQFLSSKAKELLDFIW